MEELALRWKAAYHLHAEGSREARLDSENVKRNLRCVEAIVRAGKLKPPNAPGNRRAGAA